MKQFLFYLFIVIFSIFIGSQITEGVLLVPYWQSLSTSDFYAYYQQFGPSIGRFYTILTIAAALIPLFLSIYCFLKKSAALSYSLLATFFALLFVACFYVYFKEANELFLQAAFDQVDLKNELITWSNWHWTRIGLEFLSLFFLIITLNKIDSNPK